MSVNALGVNAYTKVENLNLQNRSEWTRPAKRQAERSEFTTKSGEATKITIPQKIGAQSSALAGANDKALADILSPEEKRAIDQLFAKYDFSKMESAGYSPFGETAA
ncbi:MAG: hypothetical protein IH914_00925, partial [candidate division Zixibacteria bacterium]|nr:hypothetical protein [candidate division Zixibacteria bacterium]